MKFFVLALLSLSFIPTAQAGSIKQIDSCKISPMDSELTATGSAELTEVGLDLFINVNATLGEVGEKPNSIEGEALISLSETHSGAQALEYVKKDEIGQILAERLGQEKVSTISFYQSEGFQEDGNGFVYYRAIGEKGTRLGLLLIGWGAVYCD